MEQMRPSAWDDVTLLNQSEQWQPKTSFVVDDSCEWLRYSLALVRLTPFVVNMLCSSFSILLIVWLIVDVSSLTSSPPFSHLVFMPLHLTVPIHNSSIYPCDNLFYRQTFVRKSTLDRALFSPSRLPENWPPWEGSHWFDTYFCFPI